MSYSVTGIQPNSANFTPPLPDHVSGGVISSPRNRTAVDHDTYTFQAPSATKAATPNKVQTPSAVHDAAPTASNAAAPVDTVTLSTVDKVRQLRGEGEGDTVIATTLNLPIKEVDSDLHVSNQTPQHLSFTVAPVTSPLTTNAQESTAQTLSTNA